MTAKSLPSLKLGTASSTWAVIGPKIQVTSNDHKPSPDALAAFPDFPNWWFAKAIRDFAVIGRCPHHQVGWRSRFQVASPIVELQRSCASRGCCNDCFKWIQTHLRAGEGHGQIGRAS